MAEAGSPNVYSIAAHRGFADALVAGIVPRYSEGHFGLSRLTLLLPSARAARTLSEAFVRHAGETGTPGLLLPRMVMVGDLDLDESLGPLLDPLGDEETPPAIDAQTRWLELAGLLKEGLESAGREVPSSAGLLRLARETAATMDRLLVEQVPPSELVGERVLDMLGNLSEHWIRSLHLFLGVQDRWLEHLQERGAVDTATRRNLLFERAARLWRADPPATPIIAAGVTSAAPALARLLRVVADLPKGAVILPDLDLAMDDAAWEEIGLAGAPQEPGGAPFARADALTHPQYHLKLLLNRMGVNRAEVRQWHRKGVGAAPSERSKAISSLFLPPDASKAWIGLEASKRRLSGVRLLQSANTEEEAQSVALLVREALATPEKRVAVVTPDRALARRVAQHLARWNITADDTAGRPLSLTSAGRLLLLLAELASGGLTPVPLVGALGHPLVRRDGDRRAWLASLRAFERKLRGPRPASGLAPLRQVAAKAGEEAWWSEIEPCLELLLADGGDIALAEALDMLASVAEALAGEAAWSQEDGRTLARFVEELRVTARAVGTRIERADLHAVLRDAMAQIAVRPPYGGHPRVAIYGLLESRMTRADLIICAGMNEGTWPASPGPDPLLAPAILRGLGVPGAEFRIGLSAHDLAGAMGAPEVVLSRSTRDLDGPTIPSRFLLRIEALLGDKAKEYREETIPAIAAVLDVDSAPSLDYPRPRPDPSSDLRNVAIKVTGLDRLLGDPYQFYAADILRLSSPDPLDADPSADFAWQGTLAHEILDRWHRALKQDAQTPIATVAAQVLDENHIHILMRGLWLPRLMEGLQWVEESTRAMQDRAVLASEARGAMKVDGVRIYGRADRIDRKADGSLVIVDYKTGKPPSAAQVEAGFALQLGLLGMIANAGGFEGISGEAREFEYWSLAKARDGSFGYADVPLLVGNKKKGLTPEEFLPRHAQFLDTAIGNFIKGTSPFTAKLNPDYPGYNDFDQLMRLQEWQIRLADEDDGAAKDEAPDEVQDKGTEAAE